MYWEANVNGYIYIYINKKSSQELSAVLKTSSNARNYDPVGYYAAPAIPD